MILIVSSLKFAAAEAAAAAAAAAAEAAAADVDDHQDQDTTAPRRMRRIIRRFDGLWNFIMAPENSSLGSPQTAKGPEMRCRRSCMSSAFSSGVEQVRLFWPASRSAASKSVAFRMRLMSASMLALMQLRPKSMFGVVVRSKTAAQAPRSN